MKVKNTA